MQLLLTAKLCSESQDHYMNLFNVAELQMFLFTSSKICDFMLSICHFHKNDFVGSSLQQFLFAIVFNTDDSVIFNYSMKTINK